MTQERGSLYEQLHWACGEIVKLQEDHVPEGDERFQALKAEIDRLYLSINQSIKVNVSRSVANINGLLKLAREKGQVA